MKNDKVKRVIQFSSVIFSVISIIIVVFILSMIGVGLFTGEMSTQLLPAACGSIATAILAFGSELIFIKQSNQQLQEEITGISSRIDDMYMNLTSDDINMDDVLLTRDQLKLLQIQAVGNMYADAKTIDMSGMSLRGNVYDNYASFQQMLSNGGICRFALVDPRGKSAMIIAQLYDSHKDVSKYINDINQTLSQLALLKKEFPNQVEITIADHIPSTSITIINRGKKDRRCFVELYTYNLHKNKNNFNISRPHFYLGNENSSYWIEFFEAQFEEIMRIGSSY